LTFNYPGYELKFIQKSPCKDITGHKFTLVYKFYSPKTKYWYIINADYHECNVFAIKFYCKKDKHSEFKYSKIVNKGDVGNILISCAKLISILLASYPKASFGFSASRSVDSNNKTVEPYKVNQRFKTYKFIIQQRFGNITFTHFEYPEISCYLLVNNDHDNVSRIEREIVNMFSESYETLMDL
jgi:hypothetical protein